MNKLNTGKRYAFHRIFQIDARNVIIDMRDEDTRETCGVLVIDNGELKRYVSPSLPSHRHASALYALERGWKALCKAIGEGENPSGQSIMRAMRRPCGAGATPYFAIPVPMMAYGKGRGGRGQYSRGA